MDLENRTTLEPWWLRYQHLVTKLTLQKADEEEGKEGKEGKGACSFE